MTLPAIQATRKQRFEAALKLAGIAMREWCENQDIERSHVVRVLTGEREGGAELNAAIDATIQKYLGSAGQLPASAVA
jgi:hypothetical protein